jgi:flagellar biosynthetic protein FliP
MTCWFVLQRLFAAFLFALCLGVSPSVYAQETATAPVEAGASETAPSAAPVVSAPVAASAVSAAASSPVRSTAGQARSGVGIGLRLPGADAAGDTSTAVRVVLGLTVLAVLPSLLVCVTAFLRIIIVLSMLRHAIGMPETPPNTALIGLAVFLTLFTMSPVLQTVNQDALQPFMDGKLSAEQAYQKGSTPLREFMIRQTREQDIALMIELAKAKRPQTMADVSNLQLVPAFMLSELRAAFQIGFVVFLPFLLIDLIVSSVLMALGMMMMPPVTIALPLKVLMFILVDGWSLLLKALIGSFH